MINFTDQTCFNRLKYTKNKRQNLSLHILCRDQVSFIIL